MQFLVSWHLQSSWGEGSEETAGSVNCLLPGSKMDGQGRRKQKKVWGEELPSLFSGKLGFVTLFIAPLCTFELEDTLIMGLGTRP